MQSYFVLDEPMMHVRPAPHDSGGVVDGIEDVGRGTQVPLESASTRVSSAVSEGGDVSAEESATVMPPHAVAAEVETSARARTKRRERGVMTGLFSTNWAHHERLQIPGISGVRVERPWMPLSRRHALIAAVGFGLAATIPVLAL